MEEDFVFHIRNKDDLSSTYIFGYVKSLNDSISFVNQFLADSVIIHSGEIFKGSFESYLYDFEGLFPVKEDYTMEMIEIINKMKFKYLVCQDTFEYINFTPNIETLLIGKNTK